MSYDVIVVGGGPVGLTAAIFCTQRRLSTLVIEARELGGQLTTVYPDKTVYDYPGFLAIEAQELGRSLIDQAKEAGCEMRDGEAVQDLRRRGKEYEVRTDRGRYATRAVILAMGMGPFTPRRLGAPGELDLEGRGIHYRVTDRHAFQGRRVLVVGGGDSALETALGLVAVAEAVTLVHRRDEFRAIERNVDALHQSPVEVLRNAEVLRILGSEAVAGCLLYDNTTGEQFTRDVDDVVIQIGLSPPLGQLKEWGLELAGPAIRVREDLGTSLQGVFACGDIVTYEGKDQRLSTGLGEAAIAAMSAYKYLRQPYWA